METKRTWTKAEIDALGLPYDADGETVKILHGETHHGDGRWEDDVELIFALPDTPAGYGWQVWYQRGKTEMQDTRPWEYDKTIDGVLVRLVEKTIKVWEAVK